jgi:hypothetical protein
MQFLACILKAVIPASIVPRAYLEREWDRIQSVRICCFGDLPVFASSFNIRASDRGYSSDCGSFQDMGACHVKAGSTRKDIYSSCSII